MKTQTVELTKQELQDLADALNVHRRAAELLGLEKEHQRRIDALFLKMYGENLKK